MTDELNMICYEDADGFDKGTGILMNISKDTYDTYIQSFRFVSSVSITN